jgi:hypothetical protein
MSKKEVKMARIAMPKWLLQGFLYGMFLALVGYIVGAISLVALPGLFPPTMDLISAALAFLASIGIAYTNDITQD